MAAGTSEENIALFTVPSGKLLVIEHVSMVGNFPAGEDLDPNHTFVETEVSGSANFHFLDATRTNLTGVSGTVYVVSHSLRVRPRHNSVPPCGSPRNQRKCCFWRKHLRVPRSLRFRAWVFLALRLNPDLREIKLLT